MNNNKKKTQLSLLLFLLAAGILTAAATTAVSTSVIFADKDDDDEIEEIEKEKDEKITKLVATTAGGIDKKLDTIVAAPTEPAKTVSILDSLVIPAAEAQQQQSPLKTDNKTKEGEGSSDKGMKLVLGDIVLPINPQSDFGIELPFSKITVQPVVK